jgi:hypothetical protein
MNAECDQSVAGYEGVPARGVGRNAPTDGPASRPFSMRKKAEQPVRICGKRRNRISFVPPFYGFLRLFTPYRLKNLFSPVQPPANHSGRPQRQGRGVQNKSRGSESSREGPFKYAVNRFISGYFGLFRAILCGRGVPDVAYYRGSARALRITACGIKSAGPARLMSCLKLHSHKLRCAHRATTELL